MSFETALARRAGEIGAFLEARIADLPEGEVARAMGYALQGGKRLRGFFVLESAAIFGIATVAALPAAAAIEALHSYSLVHDDLPAMDDDDLRRGLPTVHRKWDEATAILVGDALQSLAFEMVTEGELPADRRLDLARALAMQAGARGMVRGQELDIAAESAAAPLGRDEIEELQAAKTGALILWSCTAGALMADADTEPLARYADAVGLAFQIWDDVLDVEGDAAKMGKAARKDDAAGKATFVSLMGLEAAKARARDLVTGACDALHPYGDRADTLRQAARFVISRET